MSAIDLRVSSVVAAAASASALSQKQAREQQQKQAQSSGLGANVFANSNGPNSPLADRHLLHQLQRNELCLQWQLAALQQQQQQQQRRRDEHPFGARLAQPNATGPQQARRVSSAELQQNHNNHQPDHQEPFQALMLAKLKQQQQEAVLARQLASQRLGASSAREADSFSFKNEQQQLSLIRRLNALQQQQQQQQLQSGSHSAQLFQSQQQQQHNLLQQHQNNLQQQSLNFSLANSLQQRLTASLELQRQQSHERMAVDRSEDEEEEEEEEEEEDEEEDDELGRPSGQRQADSLVGSSSSGASSLSSAASRRNSDEMLLCDSSAKHKKPACGPRNLKKSFMKRYRKSRFKNSFDLYSLLAFLPFDLRSREKNPPKNCR